jgi:branched-chain amino acid transport system permease protein
LWAWAGGGSALLLGALTLRMSGHYLPLATIAWGLALYYLHGQPRGAGQVRRPAGHPEPEHSALTLARAAACTAGAGPSRCWPLRWPHHLLDSRPGRAIRSLKNGSTMAEAMGISTFRYKVTIFVIAALLASPCRAGCSRTSSAPSTRRPSASTMGIEYLFMAVLGGVGHVWGAFLGAGLIKR